eukprot:5793584-Amphidinium_carterae.1
MFVNWRAISVKSERNEVTEDCEGSDCNASQAETLIIAARPCVAEFVGTFILSFTFACHHFLAGLLSQQYATWVRLVGLRAQEKTIRVHTSSPSSMGDT